MVDVQMTPGFDDTHECVSEVVNIYERPCFLSASLDWERHCPRGGGHSTRHPSGKLWDHMLVAHIRTVDIVRPKYNHALEVAAPIVEGEEFTDDLAAAVGIARIRNIRNHQWHVFRRRDQRSVL